MMTAVMDRGRRATPLRVLLVEDSRMLQDRLRETLAGLEGVEVAAAVDTEIAAVDAVEHGECDAVVLDLHLRRGTGIGVLRALSRVGIAAPDVVVFTNYDIPEYRRVAESFGVRHFLDKAREYERLPFVLEELRDART